MSAAAPVLMVLFLGERIDNRTGFARARDVGQVRRGEPALASEHVTATALTFAPEDLLSVSGIPGQGVVNCGSTQRVDVRSNFPDFLFRNLLRAHWRPRNAVLDDIENLRIASAKIRAVARYDRRSDLAGAAVSSMAAGAMLSVETLSFVHSLGLALEWI